MQTEIIRQSPASWPLWGLLRRHAAASLLAASLLVSSPLLLTNALTEAYPQGYAGLFTQMAQQIAAANFRLPLSSPFYGPGGIPFAYPPLGLYFLALLIKLTGTYLFFLRVLPPVLSLFSLVPLFFLTRQVSRSSWAAAAAVLFAAASANVYVLQAQAAGIVRAPALLFALSSLYFFTRQLDRRSARDLVISGLLFGLTALTHFPCALFCLAWIGWWGAFHGRPLAHIRDAFVAGGIALLTALPWLLVVIRRYGLIVFLDALRTHGSDTAPVLTQGLLPFFSTLWLHLEPIVANPVHAVFAALGALVVLLQRRYTLFTFALLITLFFPGDGLFMVLMSCMLAGSAIAAAGEAARRLPGGALTHASIALALVALLGYAGWSGFQAISHRQPLLSASAFELGSEVQAQTPSDSLYLALISQDEAEWLPFILQREPLVAQWGSEWLGSYASQTSWMRRFSGCRRTQDLACAQAAIAALGRQPQVLVTYISDRRLNNQLDSSPAWRKVYHNEHYVMWLHSGK